MNVFFYNEDNKRNLLLDYAISSYNNIPRIGEKVVIEKKWYLVEDIVNIYIYKTSRLYIYSCICLS